MTFRTFLAAAAISAGLLGAQTPASEQVFKPGGGVTPPRLTQRSEPSYTPEASAARIEGTVLLSVIVGTDGMAHDINVVKGIGNGLDEQAVIAVQKWHFDPGTKDGSPVQVRAQIEVNFRLK